MTNFLDGKTLSTAEIEKRLKKFHTINVNVFKNIESEVIREMCHSLLEAQEEALQFLFLGKRENVDKK